MHVWSFMAVVIWLLQTQACRNTPLCLKTFIYFHSYIFIHKFLTYSVWNIWTNNHLLDRLLHGLNKVHNLPQHVIKSIHNNNKPFIEFFLRLTMQWFLDQSLIKYLSCILQIFTLYLQQYHYVLLSMRPVAIFLV